ncbi:MAG TPA: hypothetical protein ENL20_04230 [Candidatus Cloacimonetes bacterium]|nr:hypothetical protein [Candidatus Cloacimonadota bacterium]
MIKELELLIQMQQKDDIIGERRNEAEALPLELNSLKQGLKTAEVNLSNVKNELENNLKDQKLKDLEIKNNKEKIGKYQNQLLTIKTNKEYKALNSEVSHLEKKNSSIDDELIALMESESQLREELKKFEDEYKKAENELKANEDRIEKKIEIVRNDIDQLKNERNSYAKQIKDTNLVKRYVALIKNKSRKAVVFNDKNACSGCGFKVRPQQVIEINEGNKIISCESCGRILVPKPMKE